MRILFIGALLFVFSLLFSAANWPSFQEEEIPSTEKWFGTDCKNFQELQELEHSVLGNKRTAKLRRTMNLDDDWLAIKAAWIVTKREIVRRPKKKEELISFFVGFVEGRLQISAPPKWQKGLQLSELYDNGSIFLPDEPRPLSKKVIRRECNRGKVAIDQLTALEPGKVTLGDASKNGWSQSLWSTNLIQAIGESVPYSVSLELSIPQTRSSLVFWIVNSNGISVTEIDDRTGDTTGAVLLDFESVFR